MLTPKRRMCQLAFPIRLEVWEPANVQRIHVASLPGSKLFFRRHSYMSASCRNVTL